MSRLLLLAVLAALVGACAPPTSSGGEVVLSTDERVTEVRAAREVLGEPVATVRGEADRLVEAVADLWVSEGTSAQRATRAEELRLAPFRGAVAALASAELDGQGPDVVAARGVVAALGDDGEALLAAAEAELEALSAVAPYDEELEALLAGWDARGSYSQQLASFDELAVAARELATTARDRTATPACTGLWERRAAAALTVAERSEELRALIRDRRGQEFDELRDDYRQDPYGLGGLLGEADAAAAADCWRDASALPGTLASIEDGAQELADVLDPADLR